ncbi:MAG: restriction endonuclease subunit S [Oscillibacter sp.]|nr:restriction endonuclease subunit S [Oscillibacter sp.]
MSEWRKVRLGDIAEFSNGVNFDKTAYAPGVKLIGVSDFGNRYYPNYDELKEVQSEVVKDNNYLRDGDIVFVRSNGNKELVGRCMLICNPPMPVTYSGFCIRCRFYNPAEYAPAFFAYLFKTASFRQAMSGNAVGANIQNLSQGRLNSYIADVPDYPTQERIADILSAYDNLIENNQKQIKLLEEAARRLYKEWFVDFRFPGYESVPIIDGVPQGWRKVSLTDLLEIKYGKAHQTLESGDIPAYGSGGLVRKVKPVLYSGESVLIPRKGSLNNILYVCGDFWTIDTMFYSVPLMPNVAKFAYLFLSGLDMNSFNIGAAVPSMTVNILDGMRVLLPTENILGEFDRMVSPFFERKTVLLQQIEAATEARNRLLPVLMNGGILN